MAKAFTGNKTDHMGKEVEVMDKPTAHKCVEVATMPHGLVAFSVRLLGPRGEIVWSQDTHDHDRALRLAEDFRQWLRDWGFAK